MVADFQKDVQNEENIKAEKVVHEVLIDLYRGTGATIDYIADQHLTWDFEINHLGYPIRVDAKFDANYERTERLPFEFMDVYPSGSHRPTWGVHPGLDFAAVVPWTFSKVVLVPLGDLGRYVSYKILTCGKSHLEKSEGWKWWETPNHRGASTWITHGVAVPEKKFAAFLESMGERKPIELPTNPIHHRRKPRLLIGGKEAS